MSSAVGSCGKLGHGDTSVQKTPKMIARLDDKVCVYSTRVHTDWSSNPDSIHFRLVIGTEFRPTNGCGSGRNRVGGR